MVPYSWLRVFTCVPNVATTTLYMETGALLPPLFQSPFILFIQHSN